jgi:hypothetical protein
MTMDDEKLSALFKNLVNVVCRVVVSLRFVFREFVSHYVDDRRHNKGQRATGDSAIAILHPFAPFG